MLNVPIFDALIIRGAHAKLHLYNNIIIIWLYTIIDIPPFSAAASLQISVLRPAYISYIYIYIYTSNAHVGGYGPMHRVSVNVHPNM